jgi:hypothetical protein
MTEAAPPVQPSPDSSAEEDGLLTDSRKKVIRIQRLGMVSRFLRERLHEDYARTVEVEIDAHKQELLDRGHGDLLEPPIELDRPTGVKAIYSHP